MISKIKKIENLAVYKNFSWENSLADKKFERINVFYGRNYSGKTTLSRLFRSLEKRSINDKYDSPSFEMELFDTATLNQQDLASHNLNVRVFNEDFIKENLCFLDNADEGIVPFAILGANVQIEQEIQEIEAQLGVDKADEETGLYKELKNSIKTESRSKKELLDKQSELEASLRKKSTDRTIGIKYKPELYGDQNYTITKIKTDIAEIKKVQYVPLSNEERKAHQNLLNDTPKNIIPQTPSVSIKLCDTTSATKDILETTISLSNKMSELLDNAILEAWVKQGLEMTGEENICKFCGNIISHERWRQIHSHFDEQSNDLDNRISALASKINTEIALCKNYPKANLSLFYQMYHEDLINNDKIIEELLEKHINELGKILECLSEKKINKTKIIPLSNITDYTDEIKLCFTTYDKIVAEANTFSTDISRNKKNAQNLLRLCEVYNFCITIDYDKKLKEIEELNARHLQSVNAYESIKRTIKEKETLLSSKRRMLKDEEEGARRVNRYLNDFFGHNFISLQAEEDENDKKIRFKIVRDGKIAYNLSEGEKSLIAFCYFIAKLDDVDTHSIEPIIWIDDPISSLDNNHVYFIYSLIVAKIAKTAKFEQLFISTHNLDFLKYVNRLKAFRRISQGVKIKEDKKAYFLIERNGLESEIRPMPEYLRRNATEFNYLFSKIYECSKIIHNTDENFQLRYHMPHYARKFFEIYLFFNYPDNTDELQKLKKFFGEEEIPPILINRLSNEGSHGTAERAMKIDDVPEAIPVAQKIIEKLKENTEQYNSFLRSIGEEISDEGV